MKIYQRAVLIVMAGILTLSLTIPARADTSMPEEFIGYWAPRNCTTAKTVKIISLYSFVTVRKNRSTFTKIKITKKEKDFYVMDLGKTEYAVKISEAGELLYNMRPDDFIINEKPAVWSSLDPSNTMSYIKCSTEDLEKNILVNTTEISGLFAMDRLYDSCMQLDLENSAECQEELFKIADTNNDGALDQKESKDALDKTIYIAKIVTRTKSKKEREKDSSDDDDSYDRNVFIERAFEAIDQDKSGTLSLAEIRDNQKSFFSKNKNHLPLNYFKAIHSFTSPIFYDSAGKRSFLKPEGCSARKNKNVPNPLQDGLPPPTRDGDVCTVK